MTLSLIVLLLSLLFCVVYQSTDNTLQLQARLTALTAPPPWLSPSTVAPPSNLRFRILNQNTVQMLWVRPASRIEGYRIQVTSDTGVSPRLARLRSFTWLGSVHLSSHKVQRIILSPTYNVVVWVKGDRLTSEIQQLQLQGSVWMIIQISDWIIRPTKLPKPCRQQVRDDYN